MSKKTKTNTTIKKKSSHKNNIKKTGIKGYDDRARALCDTQSLTEELKNVEEVFIVTREEK